MKFPKSAVELGRFKLLASTGMAGVALAAAPAYAQDADETTEEPVFITDDGVAQTESEGQIVVTGSRIRRNETTSASPLTIIDPTLQRRQGLNDTAEIIQQSPIANGSTQITSAISANTISNGGPGAATVSLRGLGANRTLVLLNSRRAGPAGTRGAVSAFDLNVLPSSIISEVQVLKDGASSVYGSDAVAGVVNILTKKSTDGLEFDAFHSQPFADGGQESNISVAWGKEFDRGHILFAADYYHQKELERRDRKFLGCEEDYVFSEDGSRRLDLIDPRTGEYACTGGTLWGHVWTYFSSNLPDQDPNFVNPSIVSLLQYSYPGDNLGNYLPPIGPATQFGDVIAPPGWYAVSYEDPFAYPLANAYHPFEQKSTVMPQTNRYTLYGDASFEITDGIEVYAEGLFNRRETYIDAYSQFYNFGYTDLYAPGDPDDPFPGWSSFGGFGAFISPTGILDNYDNWIDVDYYRGVLGTRGDVTDRISFDLHGQYSLSKGKYTFEQILNDVIYQQTLRAYGYGCSGLFSPISKKDCLQVNWVDPRVMAGYLTPEETDYFTDKETGRTRYEQMFVEASISGELFDLPAGPLGFAFGGVLRRDEINDTPGDITYAKNITCDEAATLAGQGIFSAESCFDPTLPSSLTNPEFIDNAFANPFGAAPTKGHTVTKELFAEVEIPLLADKPFFQDLTISGAARVTNVKAVSGLNGQSDSSNGNWTYKIMGNWQINDWVRLRSTYGTSFRAPALFEQFLGSQASGARQRNVDPCVRWGEQLAEGTISQRVATNCQADQSFLGGPATGIPVDHTGAGIQATVFTSGGLGQLDPETSKALTASVIFTPKFGFLPDTDIALTVDYFDITVKGEISRLDPFTILYNCYDSEDFPNSNFCSFFERGQDGDISNVRNIRRQFINIDKQVNRGFDFTLRVRHDMGSWGKLSLLGQATLQTKDTVTTLDEFENFNGEVGDPKFTGNLITTWEKGDTTFLWGITYIGKADSVADYVENFGGLCDPLPSFNPAVYGETYCVSPRTKAVWYHNASITQEIDDRFEITFGISNIFNTAPPRVSGLVTEFGQVPRASQYDFLGRRAFIQARASF
ncbi:TonB-dependent receptor domain-containing protein [Altererythrobacter sp.]|uniref:TonB-dependent receptor domain-containing protein n=1 Tax=Altererythrobacter sp. TaxID=1872480 RepID=UPI003D10BA0F